MNGIKNKIWFKTIIFILAVISTFSFTLFFICSAVTTAYNVIDRDVSSVKKEILEQYAYDKVYNELTFYADVFNFNDNNRSNIRFKALNKNGDVILNYGNDENNEKSVAEYDFLSSDFVIYSVSGCDKAEYYKRFKPNPDYDKKDENNAVSYNIKDGDDEFTPDKSVTEYTDGIFRYIPLGECSDGYRYQIMLSDFTVKVKVFDNPQVNDIFYLISKSVDFLYSMQYKVFIYTALSLLFTVIFLIILCTSAGYNSKTGKIKISWFNKIPIEIIITVVISIGGILFAIYDEIENNIGSPFMLIFGFSALVIVSTVFVSFIMIFASDIKTRGIKYSLIALMFRFFAFLFKKFAFIFKNMGLIKKTVFVVFISLSIVIFQFVIFDGGFPVVLTVTELTVAVLYILYCAVMFEKIQKRSTEIAEGKLDNKIDTSQMFGFFKRLGETVNNINSGLTKAVEDRIKSERMKTELITNVSHDIKTPLTSIINYVDLLKKENTENEKVTEYINVIDRQSDKLKKLILDLIEASKASTGNVKTNMTVIDASVLLTQALGEYEQKFTEFGLVPVCDAPDDGVNILADSSLLWRVFDNLLNNICKYSLAGTRVYLSVKKINGKCLIQFKNISKEQLNIPSEELLERFVRGEASRNTDGNGLGLSIASGLAQVQNGKLNLAVDGDLFSATLVFDVIN